MIDEEKIDQDCRYSGHALSYLEGTMDVQTKEEYARHLVSCPSCWKDLFIFRDVLDPHAEVSDQEVESTFERVYPKLREVLNDLYRERTLPERRRVELLWREHNLSEKVAASGSADWQAKKAILKAMKLWKE